MGCNNIPNESYLTEIGKPAVPKVNLMIAIPRDAEFKEIRLTPTLLKEIENIDIIPVQEPIPLVKGVVPQFSMDAVAYADDNPYPGIFGKVAGVTGFGYYKVVIVETYPVQYIPGQKEMKFYNLEGTISYQKGANIPGKRFEDGKIEKQLEGLILNYSEAKTWELAEESDLNCLIITADELIDAGNKLANWKTVRGLKTEAIKVSDILIDYPTGRDIQEKIRMYIKDMWQNRGIQWVIIIGDADINNKQDTSYFVPPRWAIDPVPEVTDDPYATNDDGYLPTDYYYACLDGDWNKDGDGNYGEMEDDKPDLFPELFIGRIPVDDKEKVDNKEKPVAIVEAIIGFEKNPTGHNKVILASGTTFENGWEATFKRETIDPIMRDKYTTIEHYHESEGDPPQGKLNYGTFIYKMNAGVDGVEYYDHGAYYAWGRNWGGGIFLRSSQVINDLIRTKNMPMIYGMMCSTSRYDYPYQGEDCIGQTFIEYIIAGNYIGATRVAWGGSDSVGDGLDRRFWKNYVNDDYWQAGKALALAKTELAKSYPKSKYTFKTILEFELFGDPEMSRVSKYGEFIDLTTSSSDISFSDDSPVEGESVTITANVHNVGFEDVSNVTVGFYDGYHWHNPNSEKKIGETTIPLICDSLTKTISDANLPGSKETTSDYYKCYMKGAPRLATAVYYVKQKEIIADINYGITFTGNPILEVYSTGWSGANPNDGSNWCGIVSQSPTGCVLKTYVYEVWTLSRDYIGWRPSDTAQFSYTATGEAENYATAQINWDTNDEEIGEHNIYVWVDPHNQIGETNKSNNIASKSMQILKSINFASAFSYEMVGLEADKTIDGDFSTRWSSGFTDNQWICIGFTQPKLINKVRLYWEVAYGYEYKIQVSNDGINWTDVYLKTGGVGGLDEINFSPVTTSYVRMYGIKRGTDWGYSLWEFEATYDASPVITAKVSSSQNSTYTADKAVDNNYLTRWSSGAWDYQWIYIDLGQLTKINRVRLDWEAAYAKSYKIQVSDKAISWTDVYSTTSGDGGLDDISFAPVTTRFVRMYGIQRANQWWGFSLWEFKACYQEFPFMTATTSSIQDSRYTADKAVDGNLSTRWSSYFSDPQWICVDLVHPKKISKVTLYWEAAYGKTYSIQVSDGFSPWTEVYWTNESDGGIDEINFTPVIARYVRMYGTVRGSKWQNRLWGYSLWEFMVE